MTDEKQPANKEGAENIFNIQKIYSKDISFEAPNSPKIFTDTWEPNNNLDINTNAHKLADNVFEVVLSITVTAKVKEDTAYLVEVHQAGIFSLENFSDTDIHGMLGSFCPNILFPYAREAISDIVSRGGFPQLLLAPINFDALYEQHMQQQAETAKQQPAN